MNAPEADLKAPEPAVAAGFRSRFPVVGGVVLVFLAWGAVMATAFDDPMRLIAENWVIIPIAFLAAAFANATAIGGGFLFVPLFIFGYDLSAVAALKLGLATQAFGMTSGALGWSRRFIDTKALVIGALASGLGVYLGTYHVLVSNALVKTMFAWVSIFIFVVIVFQIRFGSLTHAEGIQSDRAWKSGLYGMACLAGGMITAWTAIGVGEVVALYLLLVYRIRMEIAIGTGVAVLAVDSILGLGFHSQIGGITWEFLAFTAPGVLIGGFSGARLGRLVEQAMQVRRAERSETMVTNHSPLKWLFALVMLVNGIVMLVVA